MPAARVQRQARPRPRDPHESQPRHAGPRRVGQPPRLRNRMGDPVRPAPRRTRPPRPGHPRDRSPRHRHPGRRRQGPRRTRRPPRMDSPSHRQMVAPLPARHRRPHHHHRREPMTTMTYTDQAEQIRTAHERAVAKIRDRYDRKEITADLRDTLIARSLRNTKQQLTQLREADKAERTNRKRTLEAKMFAPDAKDSADPAVRSTAYRQAR